MPQSGYENENPSSDDTAAVFGCDGGRTSMAGLSIVQESSLSGIDIEIGAWSGAETWHAVCAKTSIERHILRSVVTLREAEGEDYARTLSESGVTAYDGLYADSIIDLTQPQRRVGRPISRFNEKAPSVRQCERLLTLTRAFGQPRSEAQGVPVGIDEPLKEVENGPIALLQATGGVPCGDDLLTVSFTEAFRDSERQRASHRQRILRLLVSLSTVYDVRIVCGATGKTFLRQYHHEDLPGVSRLCSDQGAVPTSEPEETAARFEVGDPMLRTLDALAREGGTATFHTLANRDGVSQSAVRQRCADQGETLATLGLVRKYDTIGSRLVELTEYGRDVLDAIEARAGRQETFETSVSDPLQSSPDSRVSPQLGRDRDSHADGSSGPVWPTPLPRWEAAAAKAGGLDGGIGLVNHPVDRTGQHYRPEYWVDRADADGPDDSAVPRGGRCITVSSEWKNPMQYGLDLAFALTSEDVFEYVLTPERLRNADGEAANGIDVASLLDESPWLLRDATCLGYLKDADATPERFIEALKEASSELRDLTQTYGSDNYECDERTMRSILLCNAHGLAGVIAHLCRLCGIDVHRELKLPEYSRHEGSDDRKDDIAKFVATMLTIQSSKGLYALYRQLVEQRPEKRQTAMTLAEDPSDPAGEFIGSLTIVGPGVTRGDLETAIRRELSSMRIHEDAPEATIPVPIDDRTDDRTAYHRVTASLCRANDLAPTRAVTAMGQALTGSPYDLAKALHRLAPETKAPGRDIHLDELRYALSTLDPECILPSLKPSVGKIVHALLDTETCLSTTELARRADVSKPSVYRHTERLEAFDFIRNTEHGWRFALPFNDERNIQSQEQDRSYLPWYVASPMSTSTDGNLDSSPSLAEVLFEVADILLEDTSRLGDPEDPIGGAFFATGSDFDPRSLCEPDGWPWLESWLPVLDAMLATQDSDPTIVTIGDQGTQQTALGRGAAD